MDEFNEHVMKHVVAAGFVNDIIEPIISYDLRKDVSSLTFNDVKSSSLEYRLKLLNAVRSEGILQPVVVVKGVDGFVLVDGNHRVALANDFQLICPMFLIYCDCNVSLFTKFCEFTEQFTLDNYKKGVARGWVW